MGSRGSPVWLPHSIPLRPSTVQGSHLHAILPPLVHQRGGAGGGHSGADRHECCGACSTSFPQLLQPSICSVEDLRVLETHHRSLDPQSLRGRVTFPDGDHPVSPPVCSSGRLDGLHRSQGSLPAGPCPSGFSSLHSVCGTGQSVPVLCSLLWPLHGSAGLLPGHGSCFRHSPFLGYPHEAVPRRLACPVVLSRISPPRPSGGSRSLSRAGHCSEPREVSPRTFSGGPVSRCVVIDTLSFRASPSPDRVARLLSTAGEFLSSTDPPASTWLSLLGMLSSLSHLVPGGRFRVRSLQLCLHSSWDCGDQSIRVPWSQDCLRDLQWWFHLPCLTLGVSLRQISPDLDFWSDASDVGWGAHLGSLTASGLWSLEQSALSINARELLAVREGLLHFQSSLVGRNVSVFCDNSTAVFYLCKEGGTRSPFLNTDAEDSPLGRIPLDPSATPVHPGVSQCAGRLSLSPPPASAYRVVPSSGGFSVFKSSVAGPNRLICNIRQSLLFHLFLSLPGSDACGHRCVPSTLGRSSGLRISSVVHHSTSAGETPDVSGDGAHLSGSILASATLVCRPSSPVAGPSGCSSSSSRPPAPASVSLPLPGSPQATPSCLEILRRFTRAAGFSSSVASHASLSRRPSSSKAYQLKWLVYQSWCHSHGHSVSRPSLSKVADFLCWLRSSKRLGVSSISGYCSMLSAVFRFQLPSLSSHPVLCDLLRSFCLELAERLLRPPAWDLSMVLRYLNTSAFEPLSVAPLHALTQKVLFLLALATAKRVGELQALFAVVTFVQGDACLSYFPQFVANSESLTCSIPRSFLDKSLSDFAAGLDDDLLLCPVRALRLYLDRTASLAPRLFVSPRCPSRSLSKNAISFFLRDVISSAGVSRPEVGRLRAHDVRSVSTSVAFHRNWSVSAVLDSPPGAPVRCSPLFICAAFNTSTMVSSSLGPFVAAGTRIG